MMRALDTCGLTAGLMVAAVVAACSSGPAAPVKPTGPLYLANKSPSNLGGAACRDRR